MHHTSHTRLLEPCAALPAAERVDAIVVPTARPARYLGSAVRLAAELDCPILLLCSGESRAPAAAGMLARAGARGAAAQLGAALVRPLFDLPTLRPSSWLAEPYVDTANKRNVAMLAARMLSWAGVLLMDDDISGLAPGETRSVAAAMAASPLRAVGWRVVGFPDNSVACHALRSSGVEQDVFIGAGALLVDVTDDVPFFPAVYNEDWLFWHDFVLQRRLGVASHRPEQLLLNPFADPARAAREEFGDVLAEGLYSLIHDGRSVLVGCLPGYWHGVLDDRRAMLTDTEDRLWKLRATRTHTHDGYEIPQVVTAVEASLSALATITADDLAAYTSQWRFDLFRWRARLHQVPRFDRVQEALGWLGVTDVHVVGDV